MLQKAAPCRRWALQRAVWATWRECLCAPGARPPRCVSRPSADHAAQCGGWPRPRGLMARAAVTRQAAKGAFVAAKQSTDSWCSLKQSDRHRSLF